MLIRDTRARSMPLSRNTGKEMFGKVWIAAVPVVIVLSSLLVAQNVPVKFPPAASVRQCSIRAGTHQCRTQRFDSDGVQWTVPVDAPAILLSTGRANWTFAQKLLPAIQIKGFHFNRPPPIN